MITDQPGRIFAVLVFGPILLLKGKSYNDIVLLILGALLIVWDLYWLLWKKPVEPSLI